MRPLPTDRIAFARQLDVLRAFSIASGDERKPVRNSDVAEISDFAASTLSQANAFFIDIGFVTRTSDGLIPSEEVNAFAHAFKWNPISAAFKLGPLMTRSWVGEALLPRLQFRDISVNEAITALAEEVGVGPAYRDQLELLLEYLEACDLIALDDGVVKLASGSRNVPPKSPAHPEQQPSAPQPEPHHRTAGPSTPSQESKKPANVLNLSVDIHVPMEELNQWSADRITAFFAGVAQVIAAKKGTDDMPTE